MKKAKARFARSNRRRILVRHSPPRCKSSRNACGPRSAIRNTIDQDTHQVRGHFSERWQLVRMQIAWSIGLVLLACAVGSQAQEGKKAADVNPALDRFKQLAGEWVGKGKHGDMEHEARIVYKVTSGGSTVVETIDPGVAHGMGTVVHSNGDALALTHYCMLG